MSASQPPPVPQIDQTVPPTRFEVELEFVTMLSSPAYLSWLALNKYFQKPEFNNYLQYLQYWATDPYVGYLTHPGPTLKALELLQEERFRKDIMRPDVGMMLSEQMLEWAAQRQESGGVGARGSNGEGAAVS